ncbi:MAG TPA: acetamidase [Clostridiales bacterium]|nr:acetamidase [Clostridiales bacterium]
MGERPLVIPDSSVVYSLSSGHPPVATVDPGSQVVFQTQDAFSNQVTPDSPDLSRVRWETVNPATGPLAVRGSEPGDTLVVDILDISVPDRGLMVTLAGFGALAAVLRDSTVRFLPIRDRQILFNDQISLPAEPMVGVIGTAPAGEPIPCGTPGSHGGNLDTRVIGPGARVYLPVFVPGAGLAMGDLHALMGDGEVVICGVEIPGEVTVRVSLARRKRIPSPIIETADSWFFLASAADLDAAVQLSIEQALAFLRDRLPLSLTDLGLLLSIAGHTQISQIVDPLKTARMCVPKRAFASYRLAF